MKKLVFLTGAGISAESGIKTFRGADGLWENYPVMQVASIEGYIKDPALVIGFYNERRRQLADVSPNEAHKLVASLEEKYSTIVVTQNIDNLHEQAGSTNVIHLHGELLKATSSDEPNDPSQIVNLDYKTEIKIGDKAKDGSQLRPFIVWFGESVPKIEDAIDAVGQADIFVVIGTSLNVYPAAGLLSYANPRAKLFLIDPQPNNVPRGMDITVIAKTATEGMKDLVKMLN